MAKLKELGSGPVNRTEREIVQRLVTELPDSFTVIPNVVLQDDQRGQPYEYDAIVVAPHGVLAVEIKGWAGGVSSTNNHWWLRTNGKSIKNPLHLIQLKAKVLASLLQASPIFSHSNAPRPPFVDYCLIFGSNLMELDLFAQERAHALLPREAKKFLTDPYQTRCDRDPKRYARFTGQIVKRICGEMSGVKPGPRRYGNYLTVEEIGRTDTGVIYTARHALLDDGSPCRLRTWYVSPYQLNESEQEKQKKRLRRSAEALHQLGDHPNITTLRAFGEQEGEFYEVTDWSETGTLSTALARGLAGRLTHIDKLRLLRSIASGLDTAHDKGVYHRNLNPETVILAPDGQPRLVDFDLAFLISAEETVYSVAADFERDDPYRPPELRLRADYDVFDSTDLYSLGALGFELLYGTPPPVDPPGAAPTEGQDPWAPLRVSEEDPNHQLATLLLQMLAPDPSDRPENPSMVMDLIDDLVEHLEQPERSAAAPPEPPDDDAPTAKDDADAVPPAPLAPPPPGEYRPGDRIDASNVVLEELGRGAATVVYSVRNDTIGDEFALKIALPGPDADLQAPIREYQLLRRLSHPAIVRAFWAGQLPPADDQPAPTYVLLDRLQGQTLAEALSSEPLPLQEAIRIAEPILDALTYLHEADPGRSRPAIVHRDLKPENVFLTASGPVLADFGSAAPQEEAGSAPVGTLSHTPPDLAEGGWDPSGDLFAVGCLLYRMVTGRLPWGDSVPGLDGPPAPVVVQGGVTPRLAAFLEQAVAPRRTERFPTAKQMAKALETALKETALPSRDETCMASSLLAQHTEASGASWDGSLLEAVTSSDDPLRVLARQLHGEIYSHETTDRRGLEEAFLKAEQRAFELERPLPLGWQTLYDDLGAFAAPRPLEGEASALPPPNPEGLRLLVVEHFHPFELNLMRGLAQRHERTVRELVWSAGATDPGDAPARWSGLEKWLDVPRPELLSDTAAIASHFKTSDRVTWLALPTGRRDRDRLTALLDQRLDLLETALTPLLTAGPDPVWLTATSGCVHLGHGLRVDVGADLPPREADAARSRFAAHFGTKRCSDGSTRLPSSTPIPTRKNADLQLVVGRLAWPDPPGAPVLASGGLSLAETLLPLLILETESDPR